MPVARPHPRFTVEEYLDYELEHAERFEYADGLILAMSGGTVAHAVVSANVSRALHARLRGRCRVLGPDVRVATGDGLYTYPDALVVCGEMVVSRYRGTETLHNPRALVEVLSPSTRSYDLGEKLERYQTIPTLHEVLLVDPVAVDVRLVRRTEAGWETTRHVSMEAEVVVAGATLPLVEIYEDVPG